MKNKEELEYICELDESKCIALRVRSTIVFYYPICEEIIKQKPKVVTRTGELVKHVEIALKDGVKIIVGELNEEKLTWDINGRFIDEYEDSDKDLYVAERYWDKHWRDKIKLSNGEFAVRYQRPHPDVEIPEPKLREV